MAATSSDIPAATRPIRWSVLGTANIAARAFLPAMRAAGGTAVAVGSRDPERAAAWAATNEVTAAVSYQQAVDADADAIYIALPNTEHVRWAKAAVASGRAVLCEKPLGLDEAQVVELLTATPPGSLLWESFVFPFHPQTALLQRALSDGTVGAVSEIVSEFHFFVGSAANIRMQTELAGGALYDVGCYPIRLARLLFGAEPERAVATSFPAAADGSGVDIAMAGVCDFPGGRRLVLSAGMRRPMSTFTRIVGSEGELRVSNPFHPRAGDVVELVTAEGRKTIWTNDGTAAFQYAAEHIGDVIRGTAEPRHLASSDSIGNARALDMVRAAMISVG
jgi:predicted dehydrogenase